MKKNTKNSNNSKNRSRKIMCFVGVVAVFSSIATSIAAFVGSRSQTEIKVDSNIESSELARKVLKSKYIKSLIKNTGDELIFDEFTVTNNLKKVLVDSIASLEKFKINNVQKKDINIQTYYAIKDNHELYVKCEYWTQKSHDKTKDSFLILIN